MNKFIGVGRLVREVEIRYTQTGKAVASYTLAIDSGFGENKKADFIPIVAWEKLAELSSTYLVKGSKVLVEGRLQIREYEKDGQKRRAAEIVAQNIEFLDSKSGQPTQTPNGQQAKGYDVSSFGTEVFPEEEIPF